MAIGAIFLSISMPENDKAKIALLNIQLIWLLVITLSSIILFFNFLMFFIKLEREAEKKMNVNLEGSLGMLMIFVAFWFLKNLWSYTIALYKGSLISFAHSLQYVSYAFGVILGSTTFFLSRKLKERFSFLNNRAAVYGISVCGYVLGAGILALLMEVYIWKFSASLWLKTFILFILAFLLLDLLIFVLKRVYPKLAIDQNLGFILILVLLLVFWVWHLKIYRFIIGAGSIFLNFYNLLKF